MLFLLGSLITAAGPDAPMAWDRAVVKRFADLRTSSSDVAMDLVKTLTGTGPVIAAAVIACVLALAATRSRRPSCWSCSARSPSS